MPVEQRGQVTLVGMESTGNRRNSWSGGRRQASSGWHEPDESRGSRPDLWAARGEIPRADSASATHPREVAQTVFSKSRNEPFLAG